MTPLGPVVVDPDNRNQVHELATLLDLPDDRVQSSLRQLRDRQIVDGRIETYWRNNPQAQPRRTR